MPDPYFFPYEYRKEDNEFALYYNGQLMFRSRMVAFLYDIHGMADDLYVLHKHGEPLMVMRQHRQFEQTAKDHPMFDLKPHTFLFEVNFPVDELNKMIQTSGYLPKLLVDQLPKK